VQAIKAPFEDLWKASGHAQKDAAAFTHWDTANPAEIPTSCAKCHSTPGFQDYVGADGSAAGKVDKAAAIGTVITCDACHNAATQNLTSVSFPSGAVVEVTGRDAVCLSCHQGTKSMVQVDKSFVTAGLEFIDSVAKPEQKMGFVNVHYFASAISRYGSEIHGSYEYTGKSYDTFFAHVPGVTACTDCHDSHSLLVKVDTCKACHQGVTKVEDLKNIRMADSMVDYNGNGDIKEGLGAEIEGLQKMLFQAIQAYAKEVAKTPIVYDAATNPYFFNDTNGDGKAGKDELVSANAYFTWSPRLMQAAYNYQVSVKDPGAYAHGAKYIIELLYDSTESLNAKISTPVDLSKAYRESAGHFDGAAMAFRDWDDAGAVPAGCVKCHTAGGLPQFVANGTNVSMAPSDGLACQTCHDDLAKFTRYTVKTVQFPPFAQYTQLPNGPTLTFTDSLDSNLCIVCHQGRESKRTVDAAIASALAKDKVTGDDAVSKSLGFKNIHYFAAGGTLFGTQAKVIYEYDGKEYAGKFNHVKGFEGCADCHDAHTLKPKLDACKGCHNVDDPTLITKKDAKEPIFVTFEAMKARLLEGIQAYAKDVAKAPIAYSASSYPYWYADKNGNGKVDAGEPTFSGWTPRLLKAAYNYQAFTKDPGAYVHNNVYVMQVLFDSISDLKIKVPTLKLDDFTRPAMPVVTP
jgi:hypothetical protein